MPETLLGLDVGTTKVAAVVGSGGAPGVRRPADGPALLGAALASCAGLRRGNGVDVAETTRGIQEATAKALRMAGVEMEAAWVGVTGQHISCLNARGEVQIARAHRQVTWEDVERVMGAAVNAVSLSPDRQMIHAISRGFWVDDQPRVRNPVGLTANRLAVDTHMVTASRNLVANLVKSVEAAGLEVAELVAEPLAGADAVLTADEEELGVLLIDVGGGTTDLGLFLEGSIAFTGAVPVGGANVTHDLAVALGITHPQAEQVKLAHGCCSPGRIPEEEETVTVPGEEGRSFSRRLLAEVIEARVQETFALVAHEMGRAQANWPPPGGAVLTGGGSLLPGIAEMAARALGCRVRLGRPRVASGPSGLLETPALATGVGLVYYAHREAESRRGEARRGWGRAGSPAALRALPILGRVVAWVKEMFSS